MERATLGLDFVIEIQHELIANRRHQDAVAHQATGASMTLLPAFSHLADQSMNPFAIELAYRLEAARQTWKAVSQKFRSVAAIAGPVGVLGFLEAIKLPAAAAISPRRK